MKISIPLSILILALAAGLGWQGHHRLASVRESHAKLVAEAATLGISPDPANPTERVLITRHAEREDKQAAAKLVVPKCIAFAKEMEALQKTGERPDEAMQKGIMEYMDLMMSLDASQLKIVIAELRAAEDLTAGSRWELIGSAMKIMAIDHPQAALAFVTESAGPKEERGMGEDVVSMALGRWAKNDPLGALEWVRKNDEKFPDLVTDDAKRSLITEAAAQDPKLALQLIGELKLKDSSQAVSSIVNAAKTPEDRSATLAALREHAATLTDQAERERLMKASVTSLAHSAAEDGFQTGSQWISNAGFSPKELENISETLAYNVKSAETAQWIEWIGAKLPADKADSSIRDMVSNWTRKDYRAAGTWLASAADGPTKQAAVRSYAETVARYDPETAAQWALTLPADEKRVQTLKQIYRKWPKDDAAGAAAFAKEHGIAK